VTGFIDDFTTPKAPHRSTRDDGSVIDLPDVLAVVLVALTFAVFAALIWAGNHQH